MKKGIMSKAVALTLAMAIVFSLTGSSKPALRANAATGTTVKEWAFDSGTDGWYYGSGWEYKYQGAAASAVSYDDGKLKVDADYSKDSGEGWSSMTACFSTDKGMNLNGVNKVTLDFYYDTAKMTTGSFNIKVYSNSGVDKYTAVDTNSASTVSGTVKKVKVSIDLDTITAVEVKDFAVCIVGVQTDYKGSLWLDNVKLIREADEAASSIYVNSTVAVKAQKEIAVNDGSLVTYTAAGKAKKTGLDTEMTLVDKKATSQAKAIYSYLEAVGKSESVIFGHQNDTHHKAGNGTLSSSDTYDVTGSYSGIIGIDALSLTGNEYSAKRYNSELGKKLGAAKIDNTAAGNVKAAAALTNYNIKQGAIITLSAHMPNFSMVKDSGNYDGKHSYSDYDFSGYSPNVVSGDVMNEILPGGKYSKVYNAYLDMIADYAGQVKGAILFRPFHENTGSWFWWGAAYCDSATYKNVYKYTVEYLRDERNIHNLIYVYGPSSDAASTSEYGVRYPGDDYVDMVGFDMYNTNPDGGKTWFKSFEKELAIVGKFAKAHNKLLAVTETGAATASPDAGDNQTALHKSGNKDFNWYKTIQEIVGKSQASYFLLWANFSENDGFYTPYVKTVNKDKSLNGHEMLDSFIKYYNNPATIFAADQKAALSKQLSRQKYFAKASTSITGFILSPVSGSRILEAVTLSARVTGATKKDTVMFILKGKGSKKLTAVAEKDGTTYKANLDAKTQKALGEKVGTIELSINGKTVDTVNMTFNIPAPIEDPYRIDNFEDYYGVDSLLTKKWTANKNTGDSITLTLSKEKGKRGNGDYSLKFAYDEAKNGWAGATIAKTVDWSSCNALQFFTVPDGNNQKTVIQITANNKVYEAYLNLYGDYCNQTAPMLVTIPFTEFCERDTAGNPKGGLVKDCSYVTSFGLWVNAIDKTPAIIDGRVQGTIYYDDITAVKTDKTVATFEVQ